MSPYLVDPLPVFRAEPTGHGLVAAAGPATLRSRLREATRPVHEALHEAEPFRRIADGRMDRDGYGRLLAALAGFHEAAAAAVDRAAAVLDLPEIAAAAALRRRRLAADCAALGRRAIRGRSPPPASDGAATGILYTVQGSVLGGAVIARQLDGCPLGPEGRSFFRASAGDRDAFRRLLPALDAAAGADPALSAAAIAGALGAFALFAACLEDAG